MKIDLAEIIKTYQQESIPVKSYFQGVQHIEIRQCNSTGYRYYYPFNIFGDDSFYEKLQTDNSSYYPTGKWEHKAAIKYVKKDDRVLEIGCGTGYFLDKVKRKSAFGVGLELNRKAITEIQEKGFNVFNEPLNDHSLKNTGAYDIVCSFQVLEHIADVKEYFESVMRCLRPNGRLIIGVPNNNPYMYRHDLYHTLNLPPHHAGLWSKNTFEKVANHFGLKTITIRDEMLREHKQWYLAQAQHYSKKRPLLGRLMKIVPRPLYKLGVRAISPLLEGRNLLAVFELVN